MNDPASLKYNSEFKSANCWYVVVRTRKHALPPNPGLISFDRDSYSYWAMTETSVIDGDVPIYGPMSYLDACRQADNLNEIVEVMES